MTDVSHLFDQQIEFTGRLIAHEDTERDVNCVLQLNAVDPARVTARIVLPPKNFGEELSLQSQLRDGKIRVEGDLESRHYVIPGIVQHSSSDTDSSRHTVQTDYVQRVNIEPATESPEGKKNKQVVRFYLPYYPELQAAFRNLVSRHYSHGYLNGWRYSSPGSFEEGHWEQNTSSLHLGGHDLEVAQHFQFVQNEAGPTEVESIVPQLRIRIERTAPRLPDSADHFYAMQENFEKDLRPLWVSLGFALARRVRPHYQELSVYDYSRGTAIQSKLYKRRTFLSHSDPVRGLNAHQLWKLVKQLAQRLDSLGPEKSERVRKTITRYIEAFEAPTLELKLVLLHSGLHLIVTKDEYLKEDESIIPEDMPHPNAGAVNWGLAKFVGITGIEWRDLFSNGVERDEIYAFNRLRNDYLKRERRSFIDDPTPVRVLQRLLERALLADLGMQPADFPVLGKL